MDKDIIDELAKIAIVRNHISSLLNSSKIDRKSLNTLDLKGQYLDKLFIQGCYKIVAPESADTASVAQRVLEEKNKLKKKLNKDSVVVPKVSEDDTDE